VLQVLVFFNLNFFFFSKISVFWFGSTYINGTQNPIPYVNGTGNPIPHLNGTGNPIPHVNGTGNRIPHVNGTGNPIPGLWVLQPKNKGKIQFQF
jgi:hypothetical protein